MNGKKPNKTKIGLHEYILYVVVTAFTLILAVPVIVVKFLAYLAGSLRAPLKSVKNFIGFLLVLFITAAGLLAFEIFVPYDIGEKTRSVMVEENDSFSSVISSLRDERILRGKPLFKAIAVITGTDKILAPGRYDFTGKVSLYKILRKFRRGDIATVLITIPEGLTVYKTAGILGRNLGIDSSVFVMRAFDTSYTRARYGFDGLEGYLYPETYRFWYGIKIDEIMKILTDEFKRRTGALFDNLPDNIKSVNDLITLASIIEAEAMYDDEKPVISSVYHNRLDRKMLLQADPTVIYALGGLDRPLYYKDLKFDSPYNTYKYKGLPPGPINSPGYAAIEAALNPDKTNYLYFVADVDGRHIFSRTLREHNREKTRIKKTRRENSRR